jgi:predicted permease
LREKLLVFLLSIYGPLLLGYLARRVRGELREWSRRLTLFLLVFANPPIVFNSIWSIDFGDNLVKALPFVYPVLMTLMIPPALLVARVLGLAGRDKGSLLSCALFSNVGVTLGGFLCYLLYGERGLYLSSLYLAFFTPYFYLVGFPLMSAYSEEKRVTLKTAAVELVTNPASLFPLAAMAGGLALNLWGLRVPGFLDTVATKWLTYVSVVGNSFAIGLGFSLSGSLRYLKHGLFVSLVKFVYSPLVGAGLVHLFGFHRMEDQILSRVILVESFMPVAIVSIVLVKLFRLGEDLANSSWVLSTLLVIPLIPLVTLLANSLG